ncbi:MAG: hypothetical protein WC229_02530 [Candidatus Paceibacterota bacterium]|jgi:hypothetical protein
MKNHSKKIFIILLFLTFLVLPFISCPGVSHAESKFWPIIQCGTGSDACDFADAISTVNRIVNWFVAIAASLGALTLAYAGAQILMNPGNASKLEDAKKMFSKTLWGLFWLLAAWLVVYALVDRFVDPSIKALRFLKG